MTVFNYPQHPPVPERLQAPPSRPVQNDYVAEFSTQPAPPARPFKPAHLRSKCIPDPRLAPPAYARASLSSRDERIICPQARVHPPTLDDFIRAQRIEKKPTGPITEQPRPGRHGFMCPSCRKCTCKECVETNLKPLLCDSAVDFVSCFCLVRACAYHVGYDEAVPFRRTLSDKPASCASGSSCVVRWSMLGCATVILPCLLLYPLYKSAYRPCIQKTLKQANRGCSCRQNAVNNN